MNEKIEQVAAALYPDWFGPNASALENYEGQAEAQRGRARRMAKIAIEAMREPTTAMLEAEPEGNGEFDKTNSVAHARAFWQAMIDEALK